MLVFSNNYFQLNLLTIGINDFICRWLRLDHCQHSYKTKCNFKLHIDDSNAFDETRNAFTFITSTFFHLLSISAIWISYSRLNASALSNLCDKLRLLSILAKIPATQLSAHVLSKTLQTWTIAKFTQQREPAAIQKQRSYDGLGKWPTYLSR